MSPVAALTSVFGVRPWLARGPGDVLSRAPVLTSGIPPLMARPVLAREYFTWSGVMSGRRWSSSATAPETTGAAIDVPPARMYAPPTMHVGHRVLKALPAASVETMCAPG